MPKVQQILSEEIRRLARKEIKIISSPLQKTLADLRHQVSDLKKQLKVRDGKLEIPIPTKENLEQAVNDGVKKIRMTPAMIGKLREKLGLNHKQFAELLSANILSVSNWERGKTVPRQAQKQKIAAIRDMGKREQKALLKEKNIVVKVRKTKKTAKKAAEPKADAAQQ